MTARTRALVGRHGRRIHFASIAPGETAWLAVCDRPVPVFGASEHGRDWPAWLTAAEDPEANLCRQCRTPLLVAALALREVEDVRASNLSRERLLEEVRSLRAQLLSAGRGALDSARRAIAREQEDARVDRRLARRGL